jgi:hypothetical protein
VKRGKWGVSLIRVRMREGGDGSKRGNGRVGNKREEPGAVIKWGKQGVGIKNGERGKDIERKMRSFCTMRRKKSRN